MMSSLLCSNLNQHNIFVAFQKVEERTANITEDFGSPIVFAFIQNTSSAEAEFNLVEVSRHNLESSQT
jgi:hypothetical protein